MNASEGFRSTACASTVLAFSSSAFSSSSWLRFWAREACTRWSERSTTADSVSAGSAPIAASRSSWASAATSGRESSTKAKTSILARPRKRRSVSHSPPAGSPLCSVSSEVVSPIRLSWAWRLNSMPVMSSRSQSRYSRLGATSFFEILASCLVARRHRSTMSRYVTTFSGASLSSDSRHLTR